MFVLGLFMLKFVSAYYSFDSPLDYLDNEWVRFTLMLMVFFALTYFATKKTLKDNKISSVVSLCVAVFASAVLMKQGYLIDFAGDEIVAWVLFVIVVAFLILLGKALYDSFGKWGVVGMFFIVWGALNLFDVSELLPWDYFNEVEEIYEFLKSGFMLFLLIVVVVIVYAFSKSEDKRKKKKESKNLRRALLHKLS